jgi:hypothetical protein
MTRRFWYHFGVSAAIVFAVTVFAWVRGWPPGWDAHGAAPASPGHRLAAIAASIAFLYVFARLLLRATGSDRATGVLGLYAASLYLPFLILLTGSAAWTLALLCAAAGVLEILDVNSSPANAARSGLYLSVGCALHPILVVVVAALVPVVIVGSGRRWWLALSFLFAVAVPWSAAMAIPASGLPVQSIVSLRGAALPGNLSAWISALTDHARQIRLSWESDFLWAYGAFAFAGLVVGSVRRVGPSRRGIVAATWLLIVVTVFEAVLEDRIAFLLAPLGFVLLILLANTGLAALAAMNPLHAGRRRMIPVGAFFLLPPIIGWVRLLV